MCLLVGSRITAIKVSHSQLQIKSLNLTSECEHVGLKAHLRDVFGVYAVDRVSHILPGRGGLIGHIGNKFAAAVYIYICTVMHQYSAYI